MDIKKIAKENVLACKPYKGGKPIDELKREMGLKNVIKIASNESPFLPPKNVLRALEQGLSSINRYPDGDCYYLRLALSKTLKVPGNMFTFGNGSDEILVLTLMGFLKKDEEVIIAEPTFLVYKIASLIQGAKLKFVPLKNYRYDLPSMAGAATDKTKIIFIANPDNPTGSYITEKELKGFLKKIPNSIIVVLDEAYREFVCAKDYPFKTVDMVRSYPIIVMRTFSKIYSLAGIRIGYAISDPDITDVLNRVREPFNVNNLAQIGATESLKDKKYVQKVRKFISEQKSYLYKELERLNIRFVQSQTNFILLIFDFQGKEVYDFLLKKGIIVRDMSGWGLENCIRITVGLQQENRLFIKYLEEFIKNR
ncbi:histidinol-phosphate transaminase [bacterium Unc6]|nr:histidinol-phosphate transaminase [bacterium Unc6]